MKSEPKVGDLVKCIWKDAFGSSTEDYTQADVDKAKPLIMTSYGILIRDNRLTDVVDGLVGLAAETDPDGHYRGVSFIPVAMVVSVSNIAAPKKKRLPKVKEPLPVQAIQVDEF